MNHSKQEIKTRWVNQFSQLCTPSFLASSPVPKSATRPASSRSRDRTPQSPYKNPAVSILRDYFINNPEDTLTDKDARIKFDLSHSHSYRIIQELLMTGVIVRGEKILQHSGKGNSSWTYQLNPDYAKR